MKRSYCRLLVPALLLAGCAGAPLPPPEEPSPRVPEIATAPPKVDRKPPSDDSARHCVALAMYWEARGEGRTGMAAVGAVIMNRVQSTSFPNDPCDVVYQGGETPPCQFSWWCDGKSDRPRDQRQWALANDTAADLLANRLNDPTNGALFFHSTAINRPWRRVQTARIGGHVFYR